MQTDFYSLAAQGIDGQSVPFSQYKGKTVLIVNTASQCGYTAQYDGLEKLYSQYKNKNLVILGFPSNDFGGQEPGTNQEIKKFCQTRFNVDFPLFSKAPVSGPEKQPVYKFLTANAPTKNEVKWNFEKFLVSPEGQVVGRFGSSVKPDDAELTAAIEKAMKTASK